jgi:hypothetical protein
LFEASPGEMAYASEPAMNDSTVGNHVRFSDHSHHTARKPERSPKASRTQA